MNKSRLEAFSDGVIAIIITIMVLEFKVPRGVELSDLAPLWPTFLSYVLSFANVGIYWNNHHHLLATVKRVDGRILWANLHLLFWLSLMPFATAWMGETRFARIPLVAYALDLLLCALAYTWLTFAIRRLHGTDSMLARAMGRSVKEYVSLASYVLSIPLAFAGATWAAGGLLAAVACVWFLPDRRIEKTLTSEASPE